MKRIVKGDTRANVIFRLKSSGVALDLTGESLEVRYRIGDGALKIKTLTYTAPTTGQAILLPSATNWDAAGMATGRVYLTTDGKLGPSWKFSIQVEDDQHATP